MDQDWNPVVIRKRGGKGGASTEQKAAVAMKAGEEVEAERRFDGGRNIQKGGPVDARKLDQADEPLGFDHVSVDVGVKMQQGRQAKGWTQKQLAQAISEKAQVINDYENGRAIPNPQILGKIERALGIRVRQSKKKGKGRG